MIHIDTLRLRIPDSHRLHAAAIARSVGEALAGADIRARGRIDHIDAQRIRVGPEVSPAGVADRVVRAVLEGLEGRKA